MSEREAPNVSVIIPVYNRAHSIGRALQSVLKQTFQEFEIIVVDDGSSDGTRAVVEGFADPRIRSISHAFNRGPAAARNSGIRLARGKYLAFLDSDDEWLAEKLSEQIALLEDPSAGWELSCSGFFVVDDDTEHMHTHAPVSSWFRRLQWSCPLSPGTTLVIRRECVRGVGLLDEGLRRHEDWDWLLKLSRIYRLAVVEKPLARIYQGSPPRAETVEVSTLRFLSKHDSDFRRFGRYYRRRVVSKHYLGLAQWFYGEQRFREGNRYLFKALLENPLPNPFRLVGLLISVADGLFGTGILRRAIHWKWRLLRR